MENIVKFEKPRDEQELKPCPFCGHKEPLFYQYKATVGLRWAIMCGACCAIVDPGYAQDKSTVAVDWNRRREPQ